MPKHHKVIVTKEYVVDSETVTEARKEYKAFGVLVDEDVNIYELTDKDMEKYRSILEEHNKS